MLEELNDVFSSALGLNGEKPVYPTYKPVSLKGTQAEAVAANVANYQPISEMATMYNKLSAKELTNQLERVSPGFSRMMAQATSIIESEMRGEMPKDMQRQYLQHAAALGISGGYGSQSSLGTNKALADLVGGSYAITQQGLNSFNQWAQRALTMTPQFNVSSMLVSPGTAMELSKWNTVNQFNADWMTNQLAAMPSPLEKSLSSFNRSVGSAGDSIAGMFIGGVMGGNMFGGGGGQSTGSYNTAWGYGMENQGAAMLQNSAYQGGWTG